MTTADKELTPVQYSPSGVKVLSFSRGPHYQCFRMHWHDRLEIIRVRSGTLYIDRGTETFAMHKGQTVLFPPKAPHRGFVREGKTEYDVVMFDVRSFCNEHERCRELLSAMFEGRAKFMCISDNAQLFSCIGRIVSLDTEDDTLEMTALIYQLLALVYRYLLIELKSEPPLDETVQKILEYIHLHFHEDISTEYLSSRFGYTSSHFCRKFKESMWLSPMKYLQIYRLEKAAEKLKEQHGNIEHIALCCGFSDQNYFARVFRAHFGVTPTAYRKGTTHF